MLLADREAAGDAVLAVKGRENLALHSVLHLVHHAGLGQNRCPLERDLNSIESYEIGIGRSGQNLFFQAIFVNVCGHYIQEGVQGHGEHGLLPELIWSLSGTCGKEHCIIGYDVNIQKFDAQSK